MAFDFTAAKVQLNLDLNNTLIQLTDDQVTRALTSAWNDSYVSVQVWDTTQTFSQGSYQNTVPSTMSTVQEISIVRDSTNFPEPVSADLWSIVAGNIQWNRNAKAIIPDSTTLYIRGRYKLTTADAIPLTNVTLQNYVVALASYNALKPVGFSKVVGFLRNDTTLGEVIAYRQEMQRDLAQYRTQLQTEYADQ